MTWLALSLQDWYRRPLRTLVSVAGIALAVAALFSLLAFQQGYKSGMQQELDRLGAHILVVPKGCPYDAASIALHGANWPCYLKSSYLKEVRACPDVTTAAPALMAAFYDDSGKQSVYVGVDEKILAVKRGWKIEGTFPARTDEILAGAAVARERKWTIGQAVALPELKNQNATISGILSPTQGADDTFIYMRLQDAQSIFKREDQLTHILVRLSDPDKLDRSVSELRGCDAGMDMNVVPLAHLFRTIESLVNSTRVLLGAVAVIALLAAGAGVSNTILMAVSERTREIGVMRALGASHRQIFRLFWLETVQLCAAGSVVGIACAFFAARGVEGWLRARLPFAPSDPLIHWNGGVLLICILCAFVIGTISGVWPAWRAAQLSPVEAMRSQGGRA